MSSAARCWASAAEPPLPKVYSRPPAPSEEISRCATSSSVGRTASSARAASRCSWSCTAMTVGTRPDAASAIDDGPAEPVERDGGSRDDADLLAQPGQDDARRACSRAERGPQRTIAYWREKLVARVRD